MASSLICIASSRWATSNLCSPHIFVSFFYIHITLIFKAHKAPDLDGKLLSGHINLCIPTSFSFYIRHIIHVTFLMIVEFLMASNQPHLFSFILLYVQSNLKLAHLHTGTNPQRLAHLVKYLVHFQQNILVENVDFFL